MYDVFFENKRTFLLFTMCLEFVKPNCKSVSFNDTIDRADNYDRIDNHFSLELLGKRYKTYSIVHFKFIDVNNQKLY